MNPVGARRLSRLRSRLSRHWHLGWPARTGIGLVVAAGLAAAIGLPWLQREAATTHADVEALRLRAAAVTPATSPRRDDAAWSTARFDALPPTGQRAQRITALLGQASRAQVWLRRVEIQVRNEAAPGVERCTLRLPVKASYVALRRFLAQAWADDPALAIDALQWRREPGSSEVQGELRISLYSRISAGDESTPAVAGRAADAGS